MTQWLPVIGITMGDPVGIGPEILAKALNDPFIHKICNPVILGDAGIIRQALALIKSKNKIRTIKTPDQGRFNPGTLNIIEVSKIKHHWSTKMSPTSETRKAMAECILKGIGLAKKNSIQGLVTCPITKTALKLRGSSFHGHTEILAHQTHTDTYAMMLAGSKLKVVLVTIHVPLSRVPLLLNARDIFKIIRLTCISLKERFHISQPKIAVAGLNPHSGEDNMFGKEEEQIIRPAVDKAIKTGMNIKGPLPPDTVFYKAANGVYDSVVCMYHDQGLIPFKLIHFKDGVNTTLGLPIIRTSVAHGTACDIAWKGIADPKSLKEAVKMAVFQAENKKK